MSKHIDGTKLVTTIILVLVTAALFLGIGFSVGGLNGNPNTVAPLEDSVTASTIPDTTTASATATKVTSATAVSAGVSKDQAVALVKDLQEVKDYLSKTKGGTVEYDHEDTAINTWAVHVYTMGADASATFNWYEVNKLTGAISKMF